jgi:hypothetical protein
MSLIRPGNAPTDYSERTDAIVAACSGAFAGEHPSVQGLALAELVATWLAGHQLPPEGHEDLLALHLDTVRKCLPIAQARIDDLLRKMGGTA